MTVVNLISKLTSPMILIPLLLLWIAAQQKNWAIVMVLVVTLAGVAILSFFRARIDESEDNSDFDNEVAVENRYLAYIVGIVIFLGAAVGVETNAITNLFFYVAALVYTILAALTFYFHSRLSLHVATVGLVIFYLSISTSLGGNESPLAAWMSIYLPTAVIVAGVRVVQGKHTVAQTFVTFVVTSACLFCATLVFLASA